MKNKNIDNKSASALLDMILAVQTKKGNSQFGYAHASGVLIAIMDWARNSSDKNVLQEEINKNYDRYKRELESLN